MNPQMYLTGPGPFQYRRTTYALVAVLVSRLQAVLFIYRYGSFYFVSDISISYERGRQGTFLLDKLL